ncbi:MAG: SLOG family protein [Oscillospiraceae bacterium]|nr:SLOG family protein [Oscillospiraceae bacterium]
MNQTCCFTGHKILPKDQIETITSNLNHTIDNLIAQGVTDFLSGGLLGFDLLAASLVLAKKEAGANVRLLFALPYPHHEQYWTERQETLLHNLLLHADETVYVSEAYHPTYMKRHSAFLATHASVCVCALKKPLCDTHQTVRLARGLRLPVINILK